MSNETKQRDTSAKVTNADMTDEMSEFSCQTVEAAFNESTSEKQMANAIRKTFNEAHGPVWNVIVGRHFGSDVTHATKKYINVEIGHLSVLVWKSN
eukprot:CAMPEP_0201592428 /NCGR_PEP_ID=MMETSP0190_2-20130828/190327_1 /ASSEMBLY_ACC=CAM_ASM_000263 /TAXON_ID=37353 /ORGANISM="Rosalina sp." /LENGTH=95 /DNA_ID=CAMNT_0048051195 /DNA_START=78 /DNA_END=365 /DNA_ORIENTATION=-